MNYSLMDIPSGISWEEVMQNMKYSSRFCTTVYMKGISEKVRHTRNFEIFARYKFTMAIKHHLFTLEHSVKPPFSCV
jgi:hypothetical protein